MKQKVNDRIKVPAALWLGLEKQGIDLSMLLRQAQLPLAVFSGQGEINTRQYFSLWQTIYVLADDVAIGIKLVKSLPTEKLPPSLLDAYHARDYRDALQRMARYKRLCVPEHLQITEEGNTCRIEFNWLYTDQPEPPALIDASMTTLLEIGRLGTATPINARRIELMQTKMDVSAHQAYFGCPIRLGAQRNCLHLDLTSLDLSFKSYNAELLDLLTPALDQQLAEYQSKLSFIETVSWLLKRLLSAGRPDIPTVALELGVSERTLQRRLMEEGTNFQCLLATVRRSRAYELLADPSLDLMEVALHLGYEDQSSFFRAFKQWENKTPSNWRAMQQMTKTI